MKIPFARPIQIIRKAGSYSDETGNWVEGPTTTINAEGSAQPFTAKELLTMPEGARTKERIKIYTTTEVRQREAGQAADLIVIGGRTYEVESVENFSMPGAVIPYYKVFAVIPNEAETA